MFKVIKLFGLIYDFLVSFKRKKKERQLDETFERFDYIPDPSERAKRMVDTFNDD